MTPAPAIAEQPKGKAWHSQSAEEVLAQLASTSEGLSSHEAEQRLATNGLNELKEGKPISPLQIFLGQFKSLIIWILIAAGVISGLLGERVDAIAILAIVVSVSFGLQVWSQHNATLGRFLKTSFMPLADCFLLLAVGAIPLLILEMVKVVRHARRQRKTEQ